MKDSLLILKILKFSMKEIFKKIIIKILKIEAGFILNKHKPFIVAITGNLGKTTTKDFIAHVYKNKYVNENVRATEKSLNSEFGIPLTILNESTAWNNPISWLKIISVSFFREYFAKNFPTYLILEIGADHKGDIKDATTYIKPDICVLTAMQKNLVHGEFFKNREEHVREKKYLAEAIKTGGILIYNKDDDDMKNIAAEVNIEKEISFGQDKNADVQIIESRFFYSDETVIEGMEIFLKINKKQKSYKLYGVLGEGCQYALAAAVSLTLDQSVPSNFAGSPHLRTQGESENVFNNIEFPKSRMRVLKGVNTSVIIDDTYNASPKATESAINTVDKILCKGKKILILGHMAELGEKAEKEEHVKIAKLANNVFDKIIFIGRNNHLYEMGISEIQQVGIAEKIKYFDKAENAIKYVKEMIGEYDIVLCKGSQSARVEKVVVDILVNYADKYEVCRQEKEWQER